MWELVNLGDVDHPLHLHTYAFQVLARNGIPEPFRAWKDVVDLRKHDVVRIAVPFESFTGRTVFHGLGIGLLTLTQLASVALIPLAWGMLARGRRSRATPASTHAASGG